MTKEIKKKIYCAECGDACYIEDGIKYAALYCCMCEEVFHHECKDSHLQDKHTIHIRQVNVIGNEVREINSDKKVKINKEWIR